MRAEGREKKDRFLWRPILYLASQVYNPVSVNLNTSTKSYRMEQADRPAGFGSLAPYKTIECEVWNSHKSHTED